MTAPAFSVIIPVYNAGGTLDDAVRSVLHQTLTDFEIEVVDDHSSDDSFERALAWADVDNRISVSRLPTNSGGPRRPRNVGIARANGRFISFLDDDDRWLPMKLEHQLAKHEQKPFALTYARCLVEAPGDPLMDGSDYHEWWQLSPHEGTQLPRLVEANFVPILTASVDHEWVRRVGPFRGLDGVDDWDYWMRIAAKGGQFGFIDEQLAVYRWTPSNLSHRDSGAAVRKRLRTLQSLGKEFPGHRERFEAEERRIRRRTTELRLRRFPAPLRRAASLALLPPRLWT